ncbi:MAG: polymer-forming cytoskeletal protein [Elusimicrobia bacterium]|nr:polymer-forming cytoskeletal protein [Elusimicrobiota bacterium]
MFGRGEPTVVDDRIKSIVAAETYIQGTLRTHGSLIIDGKVEGGIAQAKQVVVGEQGEVKGDITAESVVVGGKVTGNILAVKLVQVLSHGQIKGDIRTKSLHIEDGAVFDGACTMNVETPSGGSGTSEGAVDGKRGRVVTPLIK